MAAFTIHTFQGFWSEHDCSSNPKWLFVFGDNLLRKAKGGQAIIRYHSNAAGVPTKKTPGFHSGAFFTDAEFEANAKAIDAAVNTILKLMYSGTYETLILPEAGLGTGLAQLPTRAPKTYRYLLTHPLLPMDPSLYEPITLKA